LLLKPQDRFLLIDGLIRSLDEPDREIDDIWIAEGYIYIIAIAHGHRRPNYWIDRRVTDSRWLYAPQGPWDSHLLPLNLPSPSHPPTFSPSVLCHLSSVLRYLSSIIRRRQILTLDSEKNRTHNAACKGNQKIYPGADQPQKGAAKGRRRDDHIAHQVI